MYNVIDLFGQTKEDLPVYLAPAWLKKLREDATIEPITLMKDKDGRLVVCDGYKRWAAYTHIGLRQIPGILVEGVIDVRVHSYPRYIVMRGEAATDPEG